MLEYHLTSIFILIYKRITINNGTPHLNPPKNKTKQKSRLGTASNKITGRGGGGASTSFLQDLSPAAEIQGPSTDIEKTTDVVGEAKDKETQAESDLEEEGGDLNSPAYQPTAI